MGPTEAKVLAFVRSHIESRGWSPTLVEIGAATGLSGAGAKGVLDRLAYSGHIRRTPGKARSIELPDTFDLRGVASALMLQELERRGDMPGALARPERRAFGRARCCSADFCHTAVKYGHAFCLDHWRAIDYPTQQRLFAANAAVRRLASGANQRDYQEAFYAAKEQADALCRRAG